MDNIRFDGTTGQFDVTGPMTVHNTFVRPNSIMADPEMYECLGLDDIDDDDDVDDDGITFDSIRI